MNFLRKIISGNKKRYIDDDFNLDLSYITPRIIAMAIPGEGIKKLYRNSISDIQKFLKKRHSNHYLMINISGHKYDYSLFENNVLEYDWVDHQAPKVHTLFKICERIYKYLLENEDNIVVINCKAGKGRTGTIICCFMLFCDLFNNTQDAFNYYSYKRFKSGEGVSQPSQKRYVEFFYQMLVYSKRCLPKVVYLQGVYLREPPMSDEYLKAYYEICKENTEVVHYSSKKNYSEQKKIFTCKNVDMNISDNNSSIPLSGDFTLNIYENNRMTCRLIGRVAFNTSFLSSSQNMVIFRIDQIDPDNLIRDKSISHNYSISVSNKLMYQLKYKVCCNYKYEDPQEIQCSKNPSNEKIDDYVFENKESFKDDNINEEEIVKKPNERRKLSLRKSKSFAEVPFMSKLHSKDKEKSVNKNYVRKSSFDNSYNNPNNKFNVKGICNNCMQKLEKDKHLEDWDEIRLIIDEYYRKSDSKYMLFGKKESDVDSLIKSGKINIKGKNYEEGQKNMSMMKDGCLIF